MKIENFKVNKKAVETERQQSYLLVELNGNGCGLKGCSCSPPNFISVFNGKIGFEITLTNEEAKEIKLEGHLDIEI